MRKVEIFDWVKQDSLSPAQRVKVGEGVFHAFGVDFYELESGPGNVSVAIVEMADGTVKSVLPSLIRFTEAP